MPDTATFAAKISCPRCGAHLLNSVRCPWGAVPGITYRVGDSIQWLRNSRGDVVDPFRLIKTGDNSWQWNCGSPVFKNVYIFDEDIYSGNQSLICHNCDVEIAACVVSVKDNFFSEARAIENLEVDRILGNSRGQADIVTLNEDGTFLPRLDWFDCPIEYRGDA